MAPKHPKRRNRSHRQDTGYYRNVVPAIVSAEESTDLLASTSPNATTDGSSISDGVSETVLRFDSLLKSWDHVSQGSFASSGLIEGCPNPGLSVNGLGVIGLPLSDASAAELAKRCHKAPFGHGSETIVDDAVRDTWELHADDFSLTNPAFEAISLQIRSLAAQDLGLDAASVQMQPHKLLLYGKGAFFAKHQDSEKVDGMIGTIVVALPSSHSGGDVEVTFRDDSKRLATAPKSAFGTSYLAWYSDVHHEVHQVTKGYRLVLTYNLVQTSSGTLCSAAVRGSAAIRECVSERIGEELRRWQEVINRGPSEAPGEVVCMLDHEYSRSSLKARNMKGNDRTLVAAFADACQDTDFEIYLAALERTVEGGCEGDSDYDSQVDYYEGRRFSPAIGYHEIIDVCDERLQLQYLLNLDGELAGVNFPIEQENVLPVHALQSLRPNEEDFSGWTGNEGVSATHYYRKSAVVLKPKRFRIDFDLHKAGFESSQLRSVIEETLEQQNLKDTDETRQRLSVLSHRVLTAAKVSDRKRLSWMPSYYFGEFDTTAGETSSGKASSDLVTSHIVHAAVILGDLSLLQRAVDRLSGVLELGVWEQIGILLPHRQPQGQWLTSLAGAMRKFCRVREALQVWSIIERQYGPPTATEQVEALREARRHHLEVLLQKGGPLMKNDVESLAHIAVECLQNGTNIEDLTSWLSYGFRVPRTERGTLLGTLCSRTQLALNGPEAADLLRLLQRLTAFFLDVMIKDYRSIPDRSKIADYDLITSLGQSLAFCFTHSMPTTAYELWARLAQGASKPDAIRADLLKLIYGTIPQFCRHYNSTFNFRDFEDQAILDLPTTYLQKDVGPPPSLPVNRSRSRVDCACEDCTPVNRFLGHPEQMRYEATLIAKRRKHVGDRVWGSWNGVEVSTIKAKGNRRSIVLEKIPEDSDMEHEVWVARAKSARELLESLDQTLLRTALTNSDINGAIESYCGKLDSPADSHIDEQPRGTKRGAEQECESAARTAPYLRATDGNTRLNAGSSLRNASSSLTKDSRIDRPVSGLS